jgi:ABC-type dipeptide/oligopeptide/nickel transport system ATPase subunit
MARALLQNADVVILDESFAALDPETLHKLCLHLLCQRLLPTARRSDSGQRSYRGQASASARATHSGWVC